MFLQQRKKSPLISSLKVIYPSGCLQYNSQAIRDKHIFSIGGLKMIKYFGKILAIIVVLALVTNVYAFDGQRKGFVIGFGLGGGYTTFTQTIEFMGLSETGDRENKFGLHTDIKIGYAPSNQLLIYWMNNFTWFSTENIFDDNVTFASGVSGFGFSYSFSSEDKSAFLRGGIGGSAWMAPFDSDIDSWYGFGVVGGFGYEFAKHWSIEAIVMWSNPTSEDLGINLKTEAFSFAITLNILGY
jgi:hypothetical protein